MICKPEGPIPARIMLVGEAPGADEERIGRPFQGASGQELSRMLTEAGIMRSECFITNVCRVRPPKNDLDNFIARTKKERTDAHTLVQGKYVLQPIREGLDLLAKEIQMVQPNIIIALGGTSLWALTEINGITKWRGSMLHSNLGGRTTQVIPTIHPAAVLREWSFRAIAISDLRRAAQYRDGREYAKPAWNFLVRPTYEQARSWLNRLICTLDTGPVRLSFDLETRAGHIACAGLSHSLTDCISIPFMCVRNLAGYWTADEEGELVWYLHKILTHPNAQVVGQNILYDSQYTWRHWHFVPRVTQDCMISQHSIFSDLPKNLGFQASMYCEYFVYWKDDGKNIDPKSEADETRWWHYNCLDCVYTDEVGQVELELVKKLGLEAVHSFQQQMFWPVLQCMQRGVRIDKQRRNQLINEVQHEIDRREQFIVDLLGHPINPRSPKQMMTLFYLDLKQPIITTRAKKGVPGHATLNDDALTTIARREPLLKPLINAISDIRTMGIFLSNFLTAPLDTDGRMRCAYNIGGSESGKSAPKTYRLSSGQNAFGSGTNLQNVPSEKSRSVDKAAARGSTAGLGDPYSYPNIRSMFIPDPGYTFFDGDLDRADLQVVVWEAGDLELKQMLREGVDIHAENAKTLNTTRQLAKTWVHGCNYGGSPRTMAVNCGLTVHQAEQMQRAWFAAHPGIQHWHTRVKQQITAHHYIQNTFGYRWYIFDRIDSIIPEAIAWIPQSTVSIVINRIWMNIYHAVPEAQVLLQVHDSLAGQFLTRASGSVLPKLAAAAQVLVPYEDPLVIPFHIKTSTQSWGACE
jgi:DNA polymerase